jgi:mannose-6-phosphate isomerase-like protein (cupin superfamily)
MSKRGKIWGVTETLLATPFLEVHRLTIKPNARCSLHSHQFKWNGFFVQSGSLTISVQKNDYPLTDDTVLGPGDFTTVKPGEFHRFISGDEEVRAIEVYYPEPLSEDIVRKDCGSVNAQTTGDNPSSAV